MQVELQSLLDKALEALRRDMSHIFTSVGGKKLDAASARDLVAYIKLLTDIQDRQAKAGKELASMTEEELKAFAKDILEAKD